MSYTDFIKASHSKQKGIDFDQLFGCIEWAFIGHPRNEMELGRDWSAQSGKWLGQNGFDAALLYRQA